MGNNKKSKKNNGRKSDSQNHSGKSDERRSARKRIGAEDGIAETGNAEKIAASEEATAKDSEREASVSGEVEAKDSEQEAPVSGEVEAKDSEQEASASEEVEVKDSKQEAPESGEVEAKDSEREAPVSGEIEARDSEREAPASKEAEEKDSEREAPVSGKVESKDSEREASESEEVEAEDSEQESELAPGERMEDEQEDWDEDAEPVKPWKMMLVFFGLIAAAAVICVVFWKATHAEKPDDGMKDTFVESDRDDSLASLPGAASDTEVDGEPATSEEPEGTNRVITQDGRVFDFTDCDDIVTPKEYVNLRTEPSTAQGEATVSCRLNAGETVHRTGYCEEMGWSRVEYNDQILYVVTSYINVVTE